MKAFTDRQKISLQHINLKRLLYWRGHSPKFEIGQHIKIIDIGRIIVTKEYDESLQSWRDVDQAWTYLNKIRKERVGKLGRIVSIECLPIATLPYQVSPYSYFVQFPDGRRINFAEPYLEKVK